MCRLDDRVAVVTGSARGIGAGVAVELGKRGATVVVNYRTNASAANEVVATIEESGSKAMAVQADVSEPDDAEKLVKSAVDTYGQLDILVNNAGLTRDQLIMLMPEEDWDIVIRVNLKSAYNCSKVAVKNMMRKRYGRIINMTSVAGIAGNPGQTNYSASKAGLIGFTRALAREVAGRNITVNAVAPGYIPTDLTDVLPETVKDAIMGQIPMGRFGSTAEVASAVAFLAMEESAYITGQVLAVDGGMVMA
jgi:3-oxoacyl-[acyl-carrier protein] reductase